MRKPRGPRDEDTFDPIAEELNEMVALLDRTRLAKPGMTQAKLDAEKARSAAKFDRRMAKAEAKWDRMTILEQKAWSDEYLRRDRARRGRNAKPPKAAEIPALFVAAMIAEREAAKAAKKAREVAKAAEVAPYTATTGEEHPTPRATRPSPEPEAPAGATGHPRPERPRKRRRGPAVGSAGYQIDGVRYPPIYDEDDF